jgi:SAM-dependent methyltransferase
MVDEEFRHPRLAGIYDALDPDRSDLEPYVALVEQLGAHRVLDLGCGTGTLAIMLAERGYEVLGVDPATASVAVARIKHGAQPVRWIDGDITAVRDTERDVALMTSNTAQAITDPQEWQTTLHGIHTALRPGGYLLFETRDPAARAWKRWNRATTQRTREIPGAGWVTSWVEVTAIDWPLVSFRWAWNLASDGASLTSDSTLRFREREELETNLRQNGYRVLEVRDAPDRPGAELVFVAQRRK